MKFRHAEQKTQAELVREWDALASIRFNQLMSRTDLTFWHVLLPNVSSLLKKTNSLRVLDAGCGVGVMTNDLRKVVNEIHGIDPSSQSIKIARDHFSEELFTCASAEQFARRSLRAFDAVISNMVLMDVIDLRRFLNAVYELLRPGGALIFSITHPCFWPQYYGYAGEKWFEYGREAIVESPFRISAQQDCQLTSTHVHRPLEMYFDELSDSRFSLQVLREPMPAKNVERLYPKPWRNPRYLIGVAERQRVPTRVQRMARKLAAEPKQR